MCPYCPYCPLSPLYSKREHFAEANPLTEPAGYECCNPEEKSYFSVKSAVTVTLILLRAELVLWTP